MVIFAIDPSKSAVGGIDLQNCNVEKSPIAALLGLQVIDKLNLLAARYRAAGSTYHLDTACSAQTIQMWASWEKRCLQWHRA